MESKPSVSGGSIPVQSGMENIVRKSGCFDVKALLKTGNGLITRQDERIWMLLG